MLPNPLLKCHINKKCLSFLSFLYPAFHKNIGVATFPYVTGVSLGVLNLIFERKR
jgi:hypothetical protein